MSQQRHIIKRQILEVKLQHRADAQVLQTELSRIYRQRIVPLLDQYCTELSAPDRIDRIESLEIDIGTIDPNRLEEDFVAKVRGVLRDALAQQLRDNRQSETDQNQRARSQLELFLFFVRTGSLPWWADITDPHILLNSLQQLIDSAPEQLRRSARELVREQRSLKRIVNQFDEHQLITLAQLLTPALSRFDQAALTDFSARMQDIRISSAPMIIRQSIGCNLLHVAGTAGEQYTTASSFFKAVLMRVAADLGVTYKVLIAEITRQSANVPVHQSLMSVLETLSQEFAAPTADHDLREHDAAPLSQRPQLSEKPAETLPEPPGSHFEKSADPGSPESLPPISTLHPAQPRDQRLSDTPESPPPVSTQPHEQSFVDASEQLPEPLAAITRPERAIDLSFTDAEEIHLGNAGLVILWPFLTHFFTRLDLLEKQKFKDQSSIQRAVGLLHYLAFGEPPLPEYLLPLNKVLCGMDLTEVFDFGLSLTGEEADECNNLLLAAIAQAPILHDMSVAGFRSTFLLRHGMLSWRDGAWLLRVERETYDIVLDRFPWGWSWVKPPWMDAALRVEW